MMCVVADASVPVDSVAAAHDVADASSAAFVSDSATSSSVVDVDVAAASAAAAVAAASASAAFVSAEGDDASDAVVFAVVVV